MHSDYACIDLRSGYTPLGLHWGLGHPVRFYSGSDTTDRRVWHLGVVSGWGLSQAGQATGAKGIPMGRLRVGGLVVGAFLFAAASARGDTLLHLPMTDPRVSAIGVQVTYAVGSGGIGTFTVTAGTTDTYKLPGQTQKWLYKGDQFRLTASITAATGQAISGTLTVNGDVEPGGLGVRSLFNSSKLLKVGSSGAPSAYPAFEFLFMKGDGEFDLLNKNPFTGVLLVAKELGTGIKYKADGSVDFTQGFTIANAKADVFSTPLPNSTLSLAALFSMTAVVRLWKRHRRRRTLHV